MKRSHDDVSTEHGKAEPCSPVHPVRNGPGTLPVGHMYGVANEYTLTVTPTEWLTPEKSEASLWINTRRADATTRKAWSAASQRVSPPILPAVLTPSNQAG